MGILINNFSMDVDEWLPADNLIFSAEVTDSIYNITISGTYFKHDGIAVTTTYSGITDGYKIFYAPSDMTSSGTITITVHAENDNSDITEQNYSLLYGYNVKFPELVDWGPLKDVVIWARASNEVQCPNVESIAFHFVTADLHSRDLNAFVGATGGVNLGASIYPQSPTFFYGETYVVTISGVKDFSGNVMDPYEITFTIEDPTS